MSYIFEVSLNASKSLGILSEPYNQVETENYLHIV